MPVMIIYCPVCGKNIKYYEKCPVCGYEKNRDYEIYPTLSPISGNHRSAGIKRQEHENKRIDERVQLLIYPKIKELTEQMTQAQDRLDKLKSGHTQPLNISAEAKMQSISQSPTPGEQSIRTGNIIKFGHYEQGNGIAPIEWRVLKTGSLGILLITEKAIDCKKYHDKHMKVTWETSTIRRWLNNEFLNNAFTIQEKKSIKTIETPAHKNPKFKSYPGISTMDQVFLLSIKEAEWYLKTDNDRKCFPTLYAKNNGMENGALLGTCGWWLRSPGDDSDRAAYVNYDGSINNIGNRVGYGTAVRPAIWINY